jgi:hypothetical protein
VAQVLTEFPGQLLVVNRHFPYLGPASSRAALAVEAAAIQGAYEAMADRLFAEQSVTGEWRSLSGTALQQKFNEYATDLGLNVTQFKANMDDPAVTARVERDRDGATALGVTSTPRFFINGADGINSTSSAGFRADIATALANFKDDFVVNRRTGELIVLDSTALNPDTNPIFLYNVSVSDESGFTDTVLAEIEVIPVP